MNDLATLTDRELEAWTLAQRGMSTRAIAAELDISRSGIRSRLENAKRKLESRETEQAQILARELERAEAEGIEITFPERDRRLARSLPVLTREEAYRRYQERIENYTERKRARGARSGARTRGSDGTSRLTPRELLAKQNGRCYLCQTPLTTDEAQIEHIIPIGRGGKHIDQNLAAACSPCNLEKGSKIVAFHIDTRQPWYLA